MQGMILVTGGTGFIGRSLVQQLVGNGQKVRLLLRPSPRTPRIPRGVPVEVAVTSLNDEPGLRAAMRGIDTVYHLAGGEKQGARTDLERIDIDGTRTLAQVTSQARIKHLFFISHLGADRASAFPLLKAKGIAEEFIRGSGIPYTIIRTSLVFGPGDNFTTSLASLLRWSPGFLPLPGKGLTLLQPLWIEDLVTCLAWSLEDDSILEKTLELGGGEYLSLEQVTRQVMAVIHTPRLIMQFPNPYMRAITVLADYIFPNFPSSVFWLDYLAVNRTCAIDALPRLFGLMPARLSDHLDHLRRKKRDWRWVKQLAGRHA